MLSRRSRTADPGEPLPHNPVAALLSGLFLAGALLLWKVVSFHLLLLALLFGSSFLLGRDRPARLATGWLLLLLPTVAACFLPLHLQHDGFLTATPMLLAYALGLAFLGAAVTRSAPLPWIGAAVALFVGARFLLPSESGLSHAWETIVAKVRFLDQKPSDPELLSFHARHYWTGNYFSPTLRRVARDWPFVLVAALPGLAIVVQWWRTGGGDDADREPDTPPPTKLLKGDGIAVPLPPQGSHFVLWMVVALVGSYLMFSKLQLFAAIAAAACIGIGYAALPRFRRPGRAVFVGLLIVIAAHGWGLIPGLNVLLPDDSEARSRVVVFPPDSMNRLSEIIEEKTAPDEAILASFVISPFILTYLDRPTVLHCFFEGDLLDRFQEVVEARFGTEEQLAEVARKYGAKWYVHEAHHMVRTDPRMSQRYVAAQIDWPAEAAITLMSYAPERLRHFELVAEDGFFRLFRVRDEPRRGRALGSPAPTMWNRPLFTSLFGDPLDPDTNPAGREDGLLPEHLLHIEQGARRLLGQVRDSGPWAEREWAYQNAAEIAPFLAEPHEGLAKLYSERGRGDRASRHRARARVLRAALRGRGTLPADAVPAPIPLLD
jgi:hypothetical protein